MKFPGRICPGLIEAIRDRDRYTHHAGHFPGESARASLKLAHALTATRRRNYFPGESARASLKRSDPKTWLLRSAAFPGRICPGLIEA